jgi:Card1-like, endonuclease domain
MKALLILVGGRASIPNILTVIHQQPQRVVAVCSTDSYLDFPKLKEAINKILPSCSVESVDPVDAFDPREITDRCEGILKQYPNANWIFNITAATTIMSIAAYEVAKKYQYTCWYLNTSRARVVSLVGEAGDESVFKIDVKQYVTAYNRELNLGELEEHREQSEKYWLPFAQMLGKNPRYAEMLKQVMLEVGRARRGRPSKAEAKDYILKTSSPEIYFVLEKAHQVGLLNSLGRDEFSNIFFGLSYLQDKFLNGAWLEAYAYDEASKLTIFHDCQWNQKIVDGDNRNELDVTMTYKAQLIIAECKTGDEAFSSDTLYQLNAVANMLGNRFVGKILITSLPKKGASKEFEAKREGLSIVLATAEDLPNLGSILEKQAKNPDYPRI